MLRNKVNNMKSLQSTIQSYAAKAEKIEAIAAELNNEIQKGSAEHFIAWHNSKATANNRLSDGWVEQYRKDCL